MYTGLDKHITSGFYQWGRLVYRFRWISITLSLALTIFLGFGLKNAAHLLNGNAEYIFSPSDGEYYKEKAALEYHWPYDEDSFFPLKSYEYDTWNDLVLARNDGGNILEPKYLDLIDCVNQFIMNDLWVPFDPAKTDGMNLEQRLDTNHSRVSFFPELCLRLDLRCFENGHVALFHQHSLAKRNLIEIALNLSGSVQEIVDTDNFNPFIKGAVCYPMEKEFLMTYPTAYSGRTPMYLGEIIGGVETDERNDSLIIDTPEEEFCGNPFVEQIKYVKYMRLTYNLRQKTADLDEYSFKWRKELESMSRNQGPFAGELKDKCGSNLYKDLDIRLNQNYTLSAGLRTVSNASVVPLVISIFILVSFAYACSFVVIRDGQDHIAGIDWARSKCWVALCGISMVIMALVSGVGLLMWVGFIWNDVITSMPFLVLAIGIDDMFILLSAWHRTHPMESPRSRLATTLSEAGISITITSVTDVLSFTIGCWTTLPAVWIFCAYTAVCLAFTYIYMLTFLCPIMAIFADAEAQEQHCIVPCINTVEIDSKESFRFLRAGSTNVYCRRRNPSASAHSKRGMAAVEQGHVPATPLSIHSCPEVGANEVTLASKFFRQIYGSFILNSVTKVCVFIILLIYWAGAIYGLLNISEGMNPRLLVYKGDPFELHIDSIYTGVGSKGLAMSVVVNNAPNMAIPSQRKRLLQMVADYEQFEHGLGRLYGNRSTIFWFYSFKTDLLDRLEDQGRSLDNQTEAYYDRVASWLRTAEGGQVWQLDVNWLPVKNISAGRLDSPEATGFSAEIDSSLIDTEFQQIWPSWAGTDTDLIRHTTPATAVNATEVVEFGFFEFHVDVPTSPPITEKNLVHLNDVWNEMFIQLCLDDETVQQVTKQYVTIEFDRVLDKCNKMLNSWNFLLADQESSENMTLGELKDEWLQFWTSIRAVNYNVISTFRFQIGLYNYNTTLDHKNTLAQVREVAARYPELNITCYNLYSAFSEQYLIVLPNTIRNVLVAIPCMLIVALLLIPSVTCSILIIAAILSIDAGVVGYMTLWGVNVDLVSMITILMSIGFAVDFTAHISYAYVVSIGTEHDRCVRALETLGWPITQGALSTLLGVMVLCTAEVYIVTTFFKTTFLVITFGLVHSLVFLPVVLTTVLPIAENLRKKFCCDSSAKRNKVGVEARGDRFDFELKTANGEQNRMNGIYKKRDSEEPRKSVRMEPEVVKMDKNGVTAIDVK